MWLVFTYVWVLENEVQQQKRVDGINKVQHQRGDAGALVESLPVRSQKNDLITQKQPAVDQVPQTETWNVRLKKGLALMAIDVARNNHLRPRFSNRSCPSDGPCSGSNDGVRVERSSQHPVTRCSAVGCRPGTVWTRPRPGSSPGGCSTCSSCWWRGGCRWLGRGGSRRRSRRAANWMSVENGR